MCDRDLESLCQVGWGRRPQDHLCFSKNRKLWLPKTALISPFWLWDARNPEVTVTHFSVSARVSKYGSISPAYMSMDAPPHHSFMTPVSQSVCEIEIFFWWIPSHQSRWTGWVQSREMASAETSSHQLLWMWWKWDINPLTGCARSRARVHLKISNSYS